MHIFKVISMFRIAPSKAVVRVDWSMHALLYHKQKPYIKSHLETQ